MTDWRAVYENWDMIPEENKSLIKSLMREKPKEKLSELFAREPYARMVYEKVVGPWRPTIQHELIDSSAFPESQRPTEKDKRLEINFEKAIQQDAKHESIGTRMMVFLPILSLLFLLGAEGSYYNPNLTVFLDNTLPWNLMTWKLLLSSALALGLATAIYLLRCMKKDAVSGKGSEASITHETSVTASAFVPMFKKIRTKADDESLKNREER
ncbi:MAG: hypothetical protein QXR42_03255 [Candidatus Bathyarchaeia archaeon]